MSPSQKKLLEKILATAGKNSRCEDLFDAAGIDAKSKERYFPNGIIDVLAALSALADTETKRLFKKAVKSDMRIRDKIALGVRLRMTFLAPYKDALSHLLRRPLNPLVMTQQVWATADTIWLLAGDTATDYNHYTKRLLLSGVWGTTFLYWMNDTSKNHTKTWVFLDKRIDNVLKIGKLVSNLKPPSAKGYAGK